MNLKHQLSLILASTFIVSTVALCTYNSTVVSNQLVKDELSKQVSFTKVISGNLKSFAINRQNNLKTKYLKLVTELKNNAYDTFFNLPESQIVDISAFNYFLSSNSQTQVFSYNTQLCKSDNLLSRLNVPKSDQATLFNYIKGNFNSFDNLFSKKYKNTVVLGYKFTANDKDYIFLRKAVASDFYTIDDEPIFEFVDNKTKGELATNLNITDKRSYPQVKELVFKHVLNQIDFDKTLSLGNYQVSVLSTKGEVLASNLKLNDKDAKATEGLSLHQVLNSADFKAALKTEFKAFKTVKAQNPQNTNESLTEAEVTATKVLNKKDQKSDEVSSNEEMKADTKTDKVLADAPKTNTDSKDATVATEDTVNNQVTIADLSVTTESDKLPQATNTTDNASSENTESVKQAQATNNTDNGTSENTESVKQAQATNTTDNASSVNKESVKQAQATNATDNASSENRESEKTTEALVDNLAQNNDATNKDTPSISSKEKADNKGQKDNEPSLISKVSEKGALSGNEESSPVKENVSVNDNNAAQKDLAQTTLNTIDGVYVTEENEEKAKLVTVAYLKDFDVYVIVTSQKGNVIKPVIMSTFIIFGVMVAIFGLLLYLLLKLSKEFNHDIKQIINNVDILSTKVLDTHEQMNELTVKLEDQRSRFPHINDLTKALSNLSRSICDKVTTSTNKLTTDFSIDKKQSIEDALAKQLMQVHQSLIPNETDMPTSKFLDIASFMIPSKGNPKEFYDLFRVDQDNIGVVFGSCSKAGVEALKAINSTIDFVRQSLITETKLPGETLTALNQLLMQKSKHNLTMNIFVMILSEFTGNFIYSVAGNKVPFLIHLHKAKFMEPKLVQAPLCQVKNLDYVDSRDKVTYLDSLVFTGNGIESNAVIKDADKQATTAEGKENSIVVDSEYIPLQANANNVGGIDSIVRMSVENADLEAYEQLVALYKASQENAPAKGVDNGSKDQQHAQDICAIIIKKNANNKEFDE